MIMMMMMMIILSGFSTYNVSYMYSPKPSIRNKCGATCQLCFVERFSWSTRVSRKL